MRTSRTAIGLITVGLLVSACGDDYSALVRETRIETARPLPADVPATTSAPRTSAGDDTKQTTAGDSGTELPVPEPTLPLANPTIETAEDRLSTFALDVDTGSFTLARSYLDSGVLPDPSTVRVEEFVNAFEQDYPATDDGPFTLVTDGTSAPFIGGDQRVIRVGIQARRIADEDRRDANLTFVVDVSGSMADEGKLDAIRPALIRLVKALRPSDRVAIVVYSDDTRVLLRSTRVDDLAEILWAIDELQPSGSTYVEAGLRLGYDEARRTFDIDRINRVILLSDGVANVGETGPEEILRVIGDASRVGVDLVTVGFGLGTYNDTLMEQLADQGDGFYAYVDGREEAERLFDDDLTGTLQVVAREAKVQVEFNPAIVASYRLVGFENRAVADDDFRDDTIDGGEIGAGYTLTALYEVRLTESPGDEQWLTRTTLRWLDPDTASASEATLEFSAGQLSNTLGNASQRLQQDIYVAAFADLLRDGPWASTLSSTTIRDNLSSLADRLDDDDLASLVDLVDRYAELTR